MVPILVCQSYYQEHTPGVDVLKSGSQSLMSRRP